MGKMKKNFIYRNSFVYYFIFQVIPKIYLTKNIFGIKILNIPNDRHEESLQKIMRMRTINRLVSFDDDDYDLGPQ